MPHFENAIVSLELPDDWVDASEADVVAFANQLHAEQLIVAFGQITQRVDAAKLSDIAWTLIELKAKAMVEHGRGKIDILEATRTPAGVPSRAEFAAFDQKNSVYANVKVVAHAEHFLSLSYYRLKCTLPLSDAKARAETVFAMCTDKASA